VKHLHGEAAVGVSATAERCLSLLAAIDGYPDWYPEVVHDAEVLERGRDGLPTRARAKLHVSRGPLERDFDLLIAIEVSPPDRVMLARIAREHSDKESFEVTWEVEEDGGGRRVAVRLDASLAVPRLLPLGSIGDDLAAGFVASAARALGGKG
jgi:hypothetical protein